MSEQKVRVRVCRLPVALQRGVTLKIPYWRVESGRTGPCLLVMAAQHGNEVNGCEAIRRFVEIAGRCLKRGMVYAVPFANLPAVRHRRPHSDLGPEQSYMDTRHNMQMKWPGKKHGNDTERIAAALWESVVKPATHIVDIHCYSPFQAPTVNCRVYFTEAFEALSRVMALPFLFRVFANDPDDWVGAIGNQAGLAGKVEVGMELSGQYDVEPREVRRGLLALQNVARHLGMIPGKPVVRRPPIILDRYSKLIVIKAKCSGLFVKADLASGDYVGKGDFLGHIISDKTLDVDVMRAPAAGCLRMYRMLRKDVDVSLAAQHPFVSAGDLIARIAPAGKWSRGALTPAR